MLHQAIGSSLFSEPHVMPASMQELLSQKGINPERIFMPDTPPLIQMPKRKPKRERQLSTAELLNLFDKQEALYMVYIPHFITQCIMYFIDALCTYTTVHRLAKYKKLKRMLEQVKSEYYSALRMEMPPHVFVKFQSQRDEFLGACGPNLQIMFFTFSNELARCHKRVENSMVVCHAFMIVSLARYIEEYDAAVNAEISRRLKTPARNTGDARVEFIKRLCEEIVGEYDMPQTQQTLLAMQVITATAKSMINDMID